MDIGSVGFWGEWHMYTEKSAICSVEKMKRIIDEYDKAFPNTPLVGLVGSYRFNDGRQNLLQYIKGKGRAGWRGDSWGHAVGRPNHHDKVHTPAESTIPNAWKNGPIVMEPGLPHEQMPFDATITRAVDDALGWHVSLAQNKSRPVPSEYLPELERLVKRLGFRLVLRKAEFDGVFALTGPNVIRLE